MLIKAVAVLVFAAATCVFGQNLDSVDRARTAVSAVVDTVTVSRVLHPEPSAESVDEVARLRSEADSLRTEAKLLDMSAEKLRADSRDLNDELDRLELKSRELDETAENVGNHARDIDDDVQFRREVNHEAIHDSTLRAVTDSSPMFSSTNIDEEKEQSLRMRTQADELMMKAMKISTRMRVVEENADRKADLADKMSDRADDLCDRADDLEKRADEIMEMRNPTPFALRGHRFKATWLWTATTVPPYGDREPHVLMSAGMGVEWYPLRLGRGAISTGFEGGNFYRQTTVKGERYAISANPFVAYTFFPCKRIDAGAALGAAVQGQFGSDKGLNSAVAPYCRLYSSAHAGRHLTIGPVVRINYLARGEYFTRSIHPDRILPPGSAWIDGGFSLGWAF